ncbi:MAG: TetR/AcrR family transcriptional regulator [Anaerocolumna sp.]
MTNSFENIPMEKRQRIIEAAIEEFGTYGYELASTNRIVKTLKVSKGSLFKYFPTKLELYEYLVSFATEYLTRYINEHIELVKDKDWKKQILKFCETEFDILILEPKLYKFFYKVMAELNNPLLKSVNNYLIDGSSIYLSRIYENIQINPTLYEHIQFIIKGYNERFMNNFKGNVFDEASKKNYLTGLSVHLDLVRE